jgi:hypothetical protein
MVHDTARTVDAWYEPAGRGVFQARLYESGIVELSCSPCRRDGLVGIFRGIGERRAARHGGDAPDDAPRRSTSIRPT